MRAPILVTGGTGTLGRLVVERLARGGRDVRVLSRKARPDSPGVEYVICDLRSGAGLDEAVTGVDVIIHCASDNRGDVQATHNLAKAAAASGGRPHLVFISIVGADRLRFGYIQAKAGAEKVVVDSGLPWTILRATQFYDFILSGSRSLTRFPIVPVPKDFRVQAIDVNEVADRLVDLALGPPSGRVPDLGGPEVSTWADMIRQYLRATHRRRLVVPLPLPGTRAIRAGGLTVSDPPAEPGASTRRLTWAQFLAARVA